MRGDPDEIDQALTALGAAVADRLSAGGWRRRVLDEYRAGVTLTREALNGVIAVVGIRRTSFQWPDDWPVEVEAVLGVGYEPALNLMPLLTMDPRPSLTGPTGRGHAHGHGDGDGDGDRVTVALTGPVSVAPAVDRIVSFVEEHAPAVAHQFSNASAIEEQLRPTVATAQHRWSDDGAQNKEAQNKGAEDEERGDEERGDEGRGDDDEGSGRSDFTAQCRMVVLAAMGRHDETRLLLTTYRAKTDGERDARRFARQLQRWLDAGGPAAPPIEETLAQLPRRVRAPRPSWADTRAKSSAKKDALNAVRANSKGKTVDQLKEMIEAEHSSRGLDIAPSVIELNATMLQTEQQPFGRTRNAFKALRMLKTGGADMIRGMKHASDDDPEWLQLPDRAAYPMIAARNLYAPIDLDPAAHDWLLRVQTDAPRRIGPWVFVDLWLSRDEAAGPIAVHIAERLVGTIRQGDAGQFTDVLRAAALFDEDPFTRGRLTTADTVPTVVLEIPLPQHLDPPPTTT